MTYGRGTVAYRVDVLTATEFRQTRINFSSISPPAYGPVGRWNAARQHHADIQQLPSGEWIAAIDGDRVPSGAIVTNWLRAGFIVAGLPHDGCRF
jgi:hypothetical protein